MPSHGALLEIAPSVASALQAGDLERAIDLIRQRFPSANVKTVLDELGSMESIEDANTRFEAGDLEGAIRRLGRNDAPTALLKWFLAGRVSVQQMRTVLLPVWEMVEYPCRALPRRTWLEWFEWTGFVSDAAAPPTEPVEAWRSQVGRTVGLSWSRDRERAVWFHDRNLGRGWPARLLHTIAPPAAVLGVIDEGRGEREVILHPGRLPRADR